MRSLRSYLFAYMITLGVLILVNTLLIINSNEIIRESFQLNESHMKIQQSIDDMEGRVLRAIDTGLRGYAVTKDPQILAVFFIGTTNVDGVFKTLYEELKKQEYDLEDLEDLETEIRDYVRFVTEMKAAVDADDIEKFKEMLMEDRGYPVWLKYNGIKIDIGDFMTNQKNEFESSLSRFQQIILYTQLISFLLAGVVFFKMFLDIQNYARSKESLIREINDSQKSLQKHKDDLERTVNERTSDLKIKNEELNHAYEELQKTQIQLIQSEKLYSVSTLIDGVAHEINNPINYITGGIFVLEQYLNDPTAHNKQEVEKAIETIKEGINRTSKIVNSLHSFRGVRDDPTVLTDLNKVINDLLLMESEKIRDITIESDYKVDDELPVHKGAITLAIANILDNAIEATLLNSHKYIRIRTRWVTKNSNTWAKISIYNSGKPISPENSTRIFDPFFTTKDPGQGTGLGLSMALSIMDQHKGEIQFRNSEGGVEFSVMLPY